MDTVEALAAVQRGERLDQPTIKRLAAEGCINVTDVTNQDTPPGLREFLITSITDKGRQLLRGARKP